MLMDRDQTAIVRKSRELLSPNSFSEQANSGYELCGR